ncbi:MAG: hypothetical protein MK132_06520 [Lentisphaerales bacterium]|nr:hypothetical protein [Lentisphaerales bacterium]
MSQRTSYFGNAMRGRRDLTKRVGGKQMGINITTIETLPSKMFFLNDGGAMGQTFGLTGNLSISWHG